MFEYDVMFVKLSKCSVKFECPNIDIDRFLEYRQMDILSEWVS